jgi:predicted nuclease with TOPRIM domain
MNGEELMAKMNEILAVAESIRSETVELRAQVESLRSKVDKIDARLSYREKAADSLRTKLDKLDERLAYREKVLVGWKEIAEYIDMNIRSAQFLADESFDPLPVLKEGSRVFAMATALDAYRARQRATRKVQQIIPCEIGKDPS